MGLESSAYEQNYQQFRSLNQIMWQIPVLAMTLTGGLWFGVSKTLESPILTSALLATACVGNVILILVLVRFRHVMECYLQWLRKSYAPGYVDVSSNKKPKKCFDKIRNTNQSVRNLFVFMLSWAALISAILLLCYWIDREWSWEMPNSKTAVTFYDNHAIVLADSYEAIAFEEAYPFLVPIFNSGPLRVLDVGAGTGRDAAWIAEKGHMVVAVEPSRSMRTIAKNLHKNSKIVWIDDHLPSFTDAKLVSGKFDVVLVNAVWMHIPESERTAALNQLFNVLKPGGEMFVSLRLGPRDDERGMFKVHPADFVARAQVAGFEVDAIGDFADLLERPEVSWKIYRLKRNR